MNLSRRSLIIGASVSLLAAPAIVRAASLMKVRSLAVTPSEFVVGQYWLGAMGNLYAVVRAPGENDDSLRWRIMKTVIEPYQHNAFQPVDWQFGDGAVS
jgi:hypothetical protein